ncbi:ABC transporter permease [Tellurirhabdus bombi]|uniref:ABC transporter permease n=1 Tax=Tellurirhabdus bombi TaxID=2907205 RepID=UPI001F40DC19|nr:ABC transporter permease [Tellurirhabdus bombi]
MLLNYFTVAFRNLIRHRAFSIINITGLAIGIAACLLILQYVVFELSYDKFHAKSARIYRVQQNRYEEGKLSTQWAAGAYAVGNSFKDAFPEVEDYVKLIQQQSLMADYKHKNIKLEKGFIASPSFFSVFSYPLVAGNPKVALEKPYTLVLAKSAAQRLFGTENAVGKAVRLNNREAFEVTGVYEDMPANTHLKADYLISYATFITQAGKDSKPDEAWDWDGCLTYLLLKPSANAQALEAKFPGLVKKLIDNEPTQTHTSVSYQLQPLRDIHLYSHLMMEAETNGDGQTVYLLLGIAFFIIVIAWVNYINLATARALNRAKEVGVRKAVGSLRSQLITQFITESAVLNAIAVLLALGIVALGIPIFNDLSGQQLTLSLLENGTFWLSLSALFLLGTFLSGLYPAFVLSGFKPVEVLKGKVANARQGILLRKSLVVLQFAASLFLLVGTLAVFRQIQFMRAQKLGLDIEQTLIIRPPLVSNDSTYLQQMQAFKEELTRFAAIRSVSASTTIPGQPVIWNAGGIKVLGTERSSQYRVIGVDYDYLKTYGLKLISGRNFAKEFGSDPKALIFNKMAVKQLGFDKPEEAIGKQIDFWGETFTLVGVVDNFHQQSLREAYEPLILRLIPDVKGYFSVKMMAGQSAQMVSTLKSAWNQFFPGNPFEYFFLDQHFNDQYRADQRFGQVFGFFTALAILVACLGLFGLASFTTMQRTKEIGIRKVLGASVGEILRLLYKDFAVLVLVSSVIATPLAWYAISQWLQSYAFRVDQPWWVFVVPLFVVMLVALATVSFQSVKAALTNPVKSLKTE